MELLSFLGVAQQYISLALGLLALATALFTFTPRGFHNAVILYNWLSKNFFDAEIYKAISKLERRMIEYEERCKKNA